MGTVYRARDSRLGRDVAIKILQEKLSDSREYLLRFEREARAASALNHPNIITIFEIGEFEGAPFIAMELIEGVSLRELLKRGPVPVRKLLDIAGQIAAGLAAAHERGIVHRDLKPENVMITNDGRVKILDFGLARISRIATSADSTSELSGIHTPEGRVLGTAAYVSPEQAGGGGRSVDVRSDQFSFGSVLYELATGRRAFERNTTAETLTAILREEPEPMERLNPKLPPPLCWIVERCLAKEPGERYASTTDLARELRTLRERLPETGSGRQRIPVRWSVRTRAAGFAAIVIVAAIAIVNSSHRFAPRQLQQLPNQKYLAVLPFKDLSGRPDGQLFSQGFGDAVSARLAKYSGVQVIPPASSVPLVSKGANFQRIAQELGATLLLNASVQRSGDNLRVSYSLVDATRGTEVGGDAVNGSLQNIWSVQDEVTDSIARDLRIEQRRPATQHVGLETAKEQDLYVKSLGNLENYQNARAVDAAIDSLRDLNETAPDSSLVSAALGRAYLAKYTLTFEKEWSDRAIRACDRARALDPNSADVLLILGKVEQLVGHHDGAIAAFKRALALQPNSAEAAIGLGEAYHGARDIPAAEQAFRRGIDLRPTWWSGHQYLGNLYLAEGRYDDAVKQFREVIRLNPAISWAYTNLGVVAVTKGNLQEGVAAFEKAISLGPDAAAYSNLGYCYYFLGDYDRAAASNRKATELGPAVATYWANLADACTWSATCRSEAPAAYEKAIALLRRDLSINPKNPRAHATLAICLAKRGNRVEAREHISRALEFDPHNPTRMYQAARVANASKEPAEAISWLQRALAAGYQSFEIERDPEFIGLRGTDRYRAAFKKRTQST